MRIEDWTDDVLNTAAQVFPVVQPRDPEGRLVCAGCGKGHRERVTDLRPWPPVAAAVLRFCSECRLARAVKGRFS